MDDQEKRERSVQLFLSVHAMRRGVMTPYTEARMVRYTNLERYATPNTAEEDAAYNLKNGSAQNNILHSDVESSIEDELNTPPNILDAVMTEIDTDDGTVVNNQVDPKTKLGNDKNTAFAALAPAATSLFVSYAKPTLFSPKTGDIRNESAISRRALLLGLRTPPPTASDPEHHLHHDNAALNTYIDNQATFIHNFGRLWDEGKVGRMRRILFETAEDLFDPQRPQTMVSFIALGGADMFCRLLCLNPTWVSKEAQEAVSVARRQVSQNASAIFGPNTHSVANASLPQRILKPTSKSVVTLEQLRRPHKTEDLSSLLHDSVVNDFLGSGSDASVAGGPAIRNIGGAFGLGPKAINVSPTTTTALQNDNDKISRPHSPIFTLEEDEAVDPFGHAPTFGPFPQPMRLGLDTYRATAVENAVVIFATVVRVITEAIVCSSHMGWYLFDWRRGALIRRLLILARVGSLREGVFILVEHLLSIIGPALHLGSVPEFATVIEDSVSGIAYALAQIRRHPEIAKAVESLKAKHCKARAATIHKPDESPEERKIRLLSQQTALAELRGAVQDLLETNNELIPLGLQNFLLQQELVLASACRVMSLSLVAAVMSDDRSDNSYFDDGTINSAVPKRKEPFPQCLSRIDAMDNVVTENVDFLLHVPKFIPALLRIISKRDEKSAVRIYRGNRTMTLVADDNGNVVAPTLGGNVLPTGTPPAAGAGGATFNIAPNLQVTITTPDAAPAAGVAPPQPVGVVQNEADFDDDDFGSEYFDEEFDEDNDEENVVTLQGGTGAQNQAANQLFQTLAAANAGDAGAGMGALQNFVEMLLRNSGGGADEANIGMLLQQLQQVAAQAPAAAPPLIPTTNNTNAAAPPAQPADPMEALRQAAQGMENEMPEANAMDSIDLDWFIGYPQSQSRWRMGTMVLRGDGNYTPSVNVRPYAHGHALMAARRAEILLNTNKNGNMVAVGGTTSEPMSSLVARAYSKVRAAPNPAVMLRTMWSNCSTVLASVAPWKKIREGGESNPTTSNQHPSGTSKMGEGSDTNIDYEVAPSVRFGVSLSHIDNAYEDMTWYYETRDAQSVKRRQDSFINVLEEFEFILRSETSYEAMTAQSAIASGANNASLQHSQSLLRQHTRKRRLDHQQIINCQSEVYFVASSLLMTQNYTLAHGAMRAHNIIPILNKAFGQVFFTEIASNSVHYSASTVPLGANASNNTAGSPGKEAAAKDDEDDERHLGAVRSSPSTKIPTPTSASEGIEMPIESSNDNDMIEVTRLVKVDNGILFEASKGMSKKADHVNTEANDEAAHRNVLLAQLVVSEPELFVDEIVTKHPMTEYKTIWVKKKVEGGAKNNRQGNTSIDPSVVSGSDGVISPTDSAVASVPLLSSDDNISTPDDDKSSTADEAEEDFSYVEADEDDEDGDLHQHDPDTLRKLELVRVLHEFWNAQDRSEVLQLLVPPPLASQGIEMTPITDPLNSSKNGLVDAISEPDTLALKLAQRIVAAREDPCVETTCLHALEAFSRVSCFDPIASHALPEDKNADTESQAHLVVGPESHIMTRFLPLLKHLIEQRIWNGRHDKMATDKTGGGGGGDDGGANGRDQEDGQGVGGGPINNILPTSLHPPKRTDAVMAALGEIIKFHPRNLYMLSEYLKMKAGEIKTIEEQDYDYKMQDLSTNSFEHTPAKDKSTNLNAEESQHTSTRSIVPTTFTINLPSPVEPGRYARRQDDTFGTLLRRRLITHASDCNLLLRIIAISMMTGMTFPSNYLRKPYDTFSLQSEVMPSSTTPKKTLAVSYNSSLTNYTSPLLNTDAGAAIKWVSPTEDYFSASGPNNKENMSNTSFMSNGRRTKQTLEDYEDLLVSVVANQKRTMEPNATLLSRMFFIRQVGRQFTQQLILHLRSNCQKYRPVNSAADSVEQKALKRARCIFSSSMDGSDSSDELNPANWVAEYLSWLGVHSPTPFDTSAHRTPVVGFGGFAHETLRSTAVATYFAEDGVTEENHAAISFNSERPFSLISEEELEYAFTIAIKPTTNTIPEPSSLNAYLLAVRSKVFPTIANLPVAGETARHAQMKRVAHYTESSYKNEEVGSTQNQYLSSDATYLYHLPPSFFLAKPERCVFPIMFEADYAFVQQLPIAATIHPLTRGSTENEQSSSTQPTFEKDFVSFSFPRAPKAGVQDPNNEYVKKYSALINSSFLHNVSHSGWIREHCGQIEKDLLKDPASLVFGMLRCSAIRPDSMESTEKLCLITSSLALFLREHWLDPHHGIENMLIRLRQISYASQQRAKIKMDQEAEKQRKEVAELDSNVPQPVVTSSMLLASAGFFSTELQNTATLVENPNPFVSDEALLPAAEKEDKKKESQNVAEATDNNTTSSQNHATSNNSNVLAYHVTGEVGLMEKVVVTTDTTNKKSHFYEETGVKSIGGLVENVRVFGTSASVSVTSKFQKDFQNEDFFVVFFRILSVWLSHYSSAQRYLETIYICSHVPFAEWKIVALDIFRRLPYHFNDVQKHVLE